MLRPQVKQRRRLLIETKLGERQRCGQIGRQICFFLYEVFFSVYDTVAINKGSAVEWLFIRSISQSEHIIKPMKA